MTSSEKKENAKYKEFISTLLEKNSFCEFRREKQFDHLFPRIGADLKRGATTLLDLCCGYGRVAYFLNEEFPDLQIHGVDYMETLVDQAKKEFHDKPKTSFECYDALSLATKYQKKFDLTVLYKTISWLPYYETIVEEAIKATTQKLYITSLFWEGDIDFITKLFPSASESQNFTYLNTYSLPKFTAFCLAKGAKTVTATPMHLDIDLPKNSDSSRLQTYTVKLQDAQRLELTGPMQLNWNLIEIAL